MTIRVAVPGSTGAEYDVRVGPGAASDTIARLPGLAPGARAAVLVVDTGVPTDFVESCKQQALAAGLRVETTRITPSETIKSIETVERVLAAIAEARLERRDAVVAIGGGIVGDTAGFAAASYRRGIPVLQIPTTLLAMVDASVGGKTGVNLRARGTLLKNFAGAFWQPVGVAADTRALPSLDARTLSAGLAECLKHALISADFGEPGYWDWLVARLGSLRADPAGEDMTELVSRNVAIKAAVVASDERETADTGGRALLNLGHTFGHAMETLDGAAAIGSDGAPRPGPMTHGEAVGLGLIAAAHASAELGRLDRPSIDAVRTAVADAGLAVTAQGLPDPAAMIDRMVDDKKTRDGSIRVILPVSGRRAEVVTDPDRSVIEAGWRAIGAG